MNLKFLSMMSFFDYKMISKKGYMEMLENFYLGTHMEVRQVGPLYTANDHSYFEPPNKFDQELVDDLFKNLEHKKK